MTRPIALYLSEPHECDYLAGETAQTAFLPRQADVTPTFYGHLLRNGFRRSGDLIYRPHCPNCSSCIPTRIPVDDFVRSRSQQRIWKRNQDIRLTWSEARYKAEHFALYQRYQTARHPDSSMAQFSESDYRDFFSRAFCNTRLMEFWAGDQLMALAVIDRVDDGLSSVYTVYEPEAASRSLGTLAILHQIDWSLRNALPYVYLGYYIRTCQKMSYKINFQPLEGFIDSTWRRISAK